MKTAQENTASLFVVMRCSEIHELCKKLMRMTTVCPAWSQGIEVRFLVNHFRMKRE